MSSAQESRMALAHRIGSAYAELEGVMAVMIAGSVSRGHADRFSDIELGVFWHREPADKQRNQVIGAFGIDQRVFPFEPEYYHAFDEFFIGRDDSDRFASGLLVETVHMLVSDFEWMLDEVLVHHKPSVFYLNKMSGVFDGVPLAGEGILQKWQDRLMKFPRELKVAIVKQHAQIDHFWKWRMYLERDTNLTSLFYDWVAIQNKLMYTLCGLNGVYCFGLKWRNQLIGRLDIQPVDFENRLDQALLNPSEGGVMILAQLVEETYDLIEAHLPEINVQWYRDVFRYKRGEWS